MNSKNNSAKKSGSKKGSAVKNNIDIIEEPEVPKTNSRKGSNAKDEVIVENQTPKKSGSNKASKSKDNIVEVVEEKQSIKKTTSKKGSVVKEEIEVEKEIVKTSGSKKSAQKKEANMIIEEQVKKAGGSNKSSKAKDIIEEEAPVNPKKSVSNKGSKSKDAVVEEVSPFKAIFNKKSQPKKVEEIEEEEDDEEDFEEGVEGDDFGDDEELPEGVDEILEADELGGDELNGDELEGDEEGEFDEDELGELEARPQGFIGYGNEPDPEDEYAFEEAMAADKKPKIMGMTPNNLEVDLALVRMKIEDTLKVLSNFKDLKDPVRTRQSYIEEFKENLCTYYGYNSELIEVFLNTFSPGECVQFLEANENPRPSTIRTNTLKTNRKHLAQILMQRGVSLEPLAEWSKVGIKIFESKVPIGATPEYLAGHYMLQSASSFLPVIALAPQMGERVLDMSAAPGGKTTYIAQLMKNTGILLANDAKLERLKSLKFNLQRMGVTNCMVCNYDGRKLPGIMKGFDRVLLDAPCTGLGIIAKDHSIKSSRMLIDIKKMSHLQKELLAAAIDCCKPGGYIVYSTCSITVEENEWVVDYALKNRYVKVVETGVEVGEEGYVKYMDKRFDPTVKLTRRIYPHIHNMDGFYFAKLRKLKNGSRKDEPEVKEGEKPKKSKTNAKAQKKQKNQNGKGAAVEEDVEENEINEDEEAFEDQIEEDEEEEEIPVPPKKQAQAQIPNKNKNVGKKNQEKGNKRNTSVDLEGALEKEEKEERPASLGKIKGNKKQDKKQQAFSKDLKKKKLQ